MSYINFTLKGTGTIPTTGWVASTSNYSQQLSYAITGVTSSSMVEIILDKNSQTIAQNSALSASIDSYDGGIIFYCNTIPSTTMTFSYVVL